MQQTLGVLARLEPDSHGQTLYDFHVITGCIFRRKQAEPRSSGAAQRINVAAVAAPGCIGADGYRLSRLHFLQLRLFEISRDPEVIHRNNREQLLARLDPLACFHGLASDDTAYRRKGFWYRRGRHIIVVGA